MPPTNTPKPTANAAKERDELAAFIIDEILNDDLETIDPIDMKTRAREALIRAGYTVREEAHHD